MMNESYSRFDRATRLLQTAQDALNRGDVVTMLEALTASRYLDGLARRLQYKWHSLPSSAVDDSIAHAVDAACAAASRGRRVANLAAWLYKAADYTANDRWYRDYSRREDVDPDAVLVATDPRTVSPDPEDGSELGEEHRKHAIRVLRGLLPRVGEGQVVDVMALVIDAAEDGLPDLPSSSIAERLGISKNAARSLLSRGRKRLRRLAAQEGVGIPKDLPEKDLQDTHTDHDR